MTPLMFVGVPAPDPNCPRQIHLEGVALDAKWIYDLRHHARVRNAVGGASSCGTAAAPMSAYYMISGSPKMVEFFGKTIAYFRSVQGEAALLSYAGHGDARGDWCLDDGKVSYLDVITGWQKIDEEIPKGTKNYRKGTLTIVADCCHSGQWALDAAWHYAEMRGRGGGPRGEV